MFYYFRDLGINVLILSKYVIFYRNLFYVYKNPSLRSLYLQYSIIVYTLLRNRIKSFVY
jgi:hypothetical protein